MKKTILNYPHRKIAFLALGCVCLFSNLAIAQQTEQDVVQTWEASLAIIDKLTAQTSYITVAVPSSTAYNALEINARKCWTQEDNVVPEHALLSEVYLQQRDKPTRIFYGWLLKDNIELSHMSNAKYDIQLLECRIKQ